MPAVSRRRYAKRLEASERREQVLDAARHLIVETGSFHVTMGAVAESAGVTRPVLYDFFANSDELLSALLDRELERGTRTIADAVPDLTAFADSSPLALLVDHTRAFLDAVSNETETWTLILLPPAGAPVKLRKRIIRGREDARRALEPLVTWGAAQSPGLAGVDIELFTHSMLAVGERLAQLLISNPKVYTPERIAEMIRVVAAPLTSGAPGEVREG